jgi:hypothetical protein
MFNKIVSIYVKDLLHSDIKHDICFYDSLRIALCIVQLVKFCIEFLVNAQFEHYAQYTFMHITQN